MNLEPLQREGQQLGMLAILILGLTCLAWLRPAKPVLAPPRIHANQAQPWMADCLPGVGAKTRERMAAALRAGEIDRLPRQAQEAARQMFLLPSHDTLIAP